MVTAVKTTNSKPTATVPSDGRSTDRKKARHLKSFTAFFPGEPFKKFSSGDIDVADVVYLMKDFFFRRLISTLKVFVILPCLNQIISK